MVENVIHKTKLKRITLNQLDKRIEIFTEYKRNNDWVNDQSVTLPTDAVDKMIKIIKG